VKVLKSWITGRPKDNYLASVALEIEFHGGFKIQIRGMRLVKTDGRTALAMPNHKSANGSWSDLIIPLNQTTRDVLEEAAIAAWSRQGGDFDALSHTCLPG
jgi:DNA-binding cell septation regulator SpoVG